MKLISSSRSTISFPYSTGGTLHGPLRYPSGVWNTWLFSRPLRQSSLLCRETRHIRNVSDRQHPVLLIPFPQQIPFPHGFFHRLHEAGRHTVFFPGILEHPDETVAAYRWLHSLTACARPGFRFAGVRRFFSALPYAWAGVQSVLAGVRTIPYRSTDRLCYSYCR